MSESRGLRFGAEEGAAAVEAGLIISVLLLLVVGSVELGRAFWTHNTMLLAVEEAGRYAMVHKHGLGGTCGVQSQAGNCPAFSDTPLANCSAARARQVLSAYQVGNIEVSVNEDTISLPSTITICASSSFGFVAPQLLPLGPFNLTSRVTVPLT
jgi:Flp pilus assembly protein TadG